jgi:nucleotide-binding universal stress UspA family protein
MEEKRVNQLNDMSFQLNRILVPIDYSECLQMALRYALPLAKRYDATLTLLSVVPIPP